MANITCSFSKLNDLLGIQQVISVNILADKSLDNVINAVRDEYLTKYYGENLEYFGDTEQEKLNNLNDVQEIIELIINDIHGEKKTDPQALSKLEQLGIFSNELEYFSNADKRITNIISSWKASVRTPEPDENRIISGEAVSGGDVAVANMGRIVPSANSHIIDTNVMIEKTQDLEFNYFKGADLARNKLLENFNFNLLNRSIVDLRKDTTGTNRPITGNEDLDRAIKQWKSELYKSLTNKELYVGTDNQLIMTHEFDEDMDKVKGEFDSYHNGTGIQIGDVLSWLGKGSPELSRYNSYIILKNFDNMLSLYGSGIIRVKPTLRNIKAENHGELKYTLTSTSSLTKTWSDNEFVSVFTNQSSLYRMLVESTPLLSETGLVIGRPLKADEVAAAMSKIYDQIDRTDLFNSVKQVLEDSISKGIVGGHAGTDIRQSDTTVYLSVYSKFFKTDDFINKLKADNNQLKSTVGKNIEALNSYSFYEVYKDFQNREGNNLNIYNVIPATIAKTIFNNYNQVSYDTKLKALTHESLKTKMSDRNFMNVLRNMNSRANFASDTTLKYSLSDNNIEANGNSFTFNFGNEAITYNVATNKFTNKEGNLYDFNKLKLPADIAVLVTQTGAPNPDYPDYNEFVRTMSNVLGQVLTASNYELLASYISQYSGNKHQHVKDIVTIAAHILYLQNLRVAHLDNFANLTISEIKTKTAANLPSDIDIKQIFNEADKSFKVDFNKHAYQALRNFAGVVELVRGADVKAVVINAEGKAFPVYSQVNLMGDINNLTRELKAQPNFNSTKKGEASPLSRNPFIKSKLLKSIAIRAHIKNLAGKVKSSSKFTPTESLIYDVVFDYGLRKLSGENDIANSNGCPIFQHTVLADKSKHSGIEINGDAEVSFNNRTLPWRSMSAGDFKQAYYESQNSYYTNLEGRMLLTYNKIFRGALSASEVYLTKTKILAQVFTTTPGEALQPIDAKTFAFTPAQLEHFGDPKGPSTLFNEITNYNTILKHTSKKMTSLLNVSYVINLLGEDGFLHLAETNNPEGNVVKELLYSKDKKSGTLGVSRTLRTFISRYTNPEQFEEFMYKKKVDSMKQLDALKFEIDYLGLDGKPIPTVAKIIDHFRIDNSWLNASTGRMILYKGDLSDTGKNLVLNPLLEQYFWEQKMANDNFQNLTVGTIHGHPAKGLTTTVENEEAARTISMFKRMVIHQATYHPYVTNLENGVSFYNKVAYVNDPEGELFNQIGEVNKQVLTDGATYTLGLTRVLENNSLLDQSAAIHHKSIGGTIDHMYASAGLMKHAAHAITNERLRESLSSTMSYRRIVKKMMNNPFMVVNGNKVAIDISRDYNGNLISFDGMTKGRGVKYVNNNGELIEVLGLVKAPSATNDMYEVTTRNVSKDSQSIRTLVPINTLYDLWKVLGAERSVVKEDSEPDNKVGDSGTKGYIWSETSWNDLAHFVNKVGSWVNREGLDHYVKQAGYATGDAYVQFRQELNKRVISPKPVGYEYNPAKDLADQRSLFQPLKSSFINQITFDSGQKVGAQNLNDAKRLLADNKEPLWVTDFVSNVHSGIQLDYEHETDESHVSEMTQILSALSFNGDTPWYAENAYKAIAAYIESNMKDVLPFISKMESADKFQFYYVIAKELVSGFEGKSITSLAEAVLYKVHTELANHRDLISKLRLTQKGQPGYDELLARIEEFEKNGFKIPFSDSNIYSSLSTIIGNLYTKKGIRRKLPGIAAIITPHSGFLEIKNIPIINPNTGETTGIMRGKYSEYQAWQQKVKQMPFYEARIAAGEESASIFESLESKKVMRSSVSLGDTVIVDKVVKVGKVETTSQETIRLDTYKKYKSFKNTGKYSDMVTHHVTANSDLGPSTFTWNFEGDDKNHSIYDLPVTELSFVIRELESATKAIQALKGNVDFKELSGYEKEQLTNDIKKKVQNFNALLEEHNNLVNVSLVMDNSPLDVAPIAPTYSPEGVDLHLPEGFKVKFNDKVFTLLKNAIKKEYKRIYEEKTVPLTMDQLNLLESSSKEFVAKYGENAKSLASDYLAFKSDTGLKGITAVRLWANSNQPRFRLSKYTITPAEIALPKIFKSKFDLSRDTNVNDVNEQYFIDKYNSRSLPEAGTPHDFYIRDLKGKHVYIFLENSKAHRAASLQDLGVERTTVTDSKGVEKVYRVDEEGNAMYEVADVQFKQFSFAGRPTEAIVIKSINDLKNLEVLTRGKNSTLSEIVTNFAAGVETAKLGFEYQKQKYKDNPYKLRNIDKNIATFNEILNQGNNLIGEQGIPTPIGLDLLDVYDLDWVNGELDSLTKRIPNIQDPNELIRAEDKLARLNEYRTILNDYSTTKDIDAKSALESQAIIIAGKTHDEIIYKLNKKAAKSSNRLTKNDNDPQAKAMDFLTRVSQYQYADIMKQNAQRAKEVYNSFVQSLEFTVARIPGQGMQSFMPMKVAFFLDTEGNTAMVTPYNLWLTGGDFDIDKVFCVGYSFDSNGKLISWHPEFNYDTPESLKASLHLPIPDSKERTYVEQVGRNTAVLSQNEVQLVIDYYATKKDKMRPTIEAFTAFVNLMNKIYRADSFTISNTTMDDSSLIDAFSVLLNGDGKKQLGYFFEQSNDKHPVEATLNVIAANMYNAIADPRNAVHAFAPVDMNEPAKAAEKSSKGIYAQNISVSEITVLAQFKEGNMVGKDVIGIAATGLKVFSALSTRYMRLRHGDFTNLPFYKKIKTFINRDGRTVMSDEKIITHIAGLNFDGVEDKLREFLSLNGNMDEKVIQDVVDNLGYEGDAALILSALLSAATDNAKELILGKINADPETAGMYVYAIIMGVDFGVFANMMTSPEVEVIKSLSKENLFDETTKKNNLKSAIRVINSGFNPIKYMKNTAINAAAKQIIELQEKGKINVVELADLLKDSKTKPSGYDILKMISVKASVKELELIGSVVDDAINVDSEFTDGPTKFTRALTEEEWEAKKLTFEAGEAGEESQDDGFSGQDDGQSYDYDQEADHSNNYDGALGDEDFAENYQKGPDKVSVKVGFNRFLNDALRLRKLIKPGFNTEVVAQFEQIADASEALTVLGGQLSINQSIKSTDYDLYSFFRQLETYISKKIGSYPFLESSLSPLGREIYNTGFDTTRFVNDSDYKQEAMKLYTVAKDDLDVLEILSSVDHFYRMYVLAKQAQISRSSLSVRSRLIDSITQELFASNIITPQVVARTDMDPLVYPGTVTKDDFVKIAGFAEDVIISNFLGSTNYKFKLKTGDISVNSEGQPVRLNSDATISLKDANDRAAFTAWFEETVMPDLRKGYERDGNGTRKVDPNIELRENYFIQQFTQDSATDIITKQSYTFCRLPINMTQIVSQADQYVFDELSTAFANLRKFTYGGRSVVELLYLYNLIVNRNRVTRSSLNKLFRSVTDNFETNSLIRDHLNFVAELDYSRASLKEGEHYHINDVILKGVAVEKDFIPKDPTDISEKFIKIKGPLDDGRWGYRYYTLVGKVYEEQTIKGLDKNIRISNGIKDLSSIISSSKNRQFSKLLDRVFDVIKVEQDDETCK